MGEVNNIPTNLEINSRIRVGNEIATIKYIGEVCERYKQTKYKIKNY